MGYNTSAREAISLSSAARYAQPHVGPTRPSFTDSYPMVPQLSPCAARDWLSGGRAVSQEPELSIKPTLGPALTNACATLPPACE